MVGVLLGLMGLFVRFVMMSTGVFCCLACCVVRRFCWRGVGIEGVFVVDGVVVVFEVTAFDSETGCPVMFCQFDSYEAAVGYVRGQLGVSCNGRFGFCIGEVWYNGECYRKELAGLC